MSENNNILPHIDGEMANGCVCPDHKACNHGGTSTPVGGEKFIDNQEKTSGTISPVADDKELHTKNLTPKQARFIIEYLIDLNATQAAIRAGYAESGASVEGHRLLSNAKISKAIEEQMQYRAQRTLITADYILCSMKEVAERCLERQAVMYFDYEEKCMKQRTAMTKDPDTGELKEEGLWEFDSAGANKALENLARNQKLLTDRSEVGNLDGTNFQFPDIKETFVDSPAALIPKEPEPGTDGQ